MRKIQIAIFTIILIISTYSLFGTKIVLKVLAEEDKPTIIITEIAAHEPSNLEWIEIFNTTNQDLDISNLILYENNTNHSVSSNGLLPAKTYAIIANKAEELTFENSDLIFDSSWSSLSLSGENLQLILNGEIQDSVTYQAFTENTSLERVHLNQEYTDQWTHHPDSNSALQINYNQIQEQEICTTETTIIAEIEYQESPTLLFSEVSFKNTTKDWIEIFIDPKNQELNLQDYKLRIDNSEDPISELTINEPQLLILETTLVGTTEQILLTHQNQILDVFCWTNSSPTQSETDELQELLDSDNWINECLDSDTINNNQTISRTNFFTDTNTLKDWSQIKETKAELNIYQNQAPTAKISIQSGKTSAEEKVSINLDASQSTDPDDDTLNYLWDFGDTTSDKINPATTIFTDQGIHPITLTVTDTSGSSSIATLYIEVLPKTEKTITNTQQKTSSSSTTAVSNSQNPPAFTDGNIALHSFFPNPEGADEGKEWITLINNDMQNINLENWILDDSQDSGSKPYIITNIELAPNETYTFTDTVTGLVLNNSTDSVRLLKPNQELKEQTNYSESKDNETFIKIDNQWTRSTEVNQPQSNITASLISDINNPTKTSKTSNSKLNAVNGTKNSELQITEIFPNPKGTDTGQEWVELYNPSSETTELSNWKLKYNTKEQILGNEQVLANSYKQIPITSGALPNSSTNLVLLDFEDNIISQISYDESKENQSYSNVSGEWIWTDILTPNQPNPEIIELEGTITNFNLENQTLTLSNNNQESQILFNSKNLSADFNTESQYKVKLKAFKHNSNLLLTEFITIEKIPEPTKNSNQLPIIIILSALAVCSIIFKKQIITFLKKHQLWHNEENLNPENVQQKAS